MDDNMYFKIYVSNRIYIAVITHDGEHSINFMFENQINRFGEGSEEEVVGFDSGDFENKEIDIFIENLGNYGYKPIYEFSLAKDVDVGLSDNEMAKRIRKEFMKAVEIVKSKGWFNDR